MVRLETASPPSSGHELTGLYKRHSAEVFRFALHLTGRRADAEDVVQQVFLQAHRHLESGRELVSARSWLLTAAKHRAFNLARDRREVPVESAPLALAPDPPDTDEVALLADVRAMLWTLPEHQHQAFVLRHWSGLSQQEIAGVLDTTPAAVESLLTRARSALLSEQRMASEACRRVRRRLVDAVALSDDDSHHTDSCRRCKHAQGRLTRAANVAGVLALAPRRHVADAIARAVPGFSAHAATAGAVAASASGSAAGGGGIGAFGSTAAVTTATKAALVVKAVVAVLAVTAAVGAVPSVRHAVTSVLPGHTPVRTSSGHPVHTAKGSPAPSSNGSGGRPVAPGNGHAIGHGRSAAGVGRPGANGKGHGVGRAHGGGKPSSGGTYGKANGVGKANSGKANSGKPTGQNKAKGVGKTSSGGKPTPPGHTSPPGKSHAGGKP